MAWFKVDDGFNNHRKVKELRRGTERLRAIGLWTLAGSYSSDEGLGGLVPESIVEEWGATKKDVEALIRVGLWKHVDEAAAEFHDWDHYQPDAATLKAQRDKESISGQIGNHRRWHVKRGVSVPDCEFCYRVPDQDPDRGPESGPESGANRVSVGSASPVPVPDPDISPNGEMTRPRPDVERLCEHLADRIEANGSKRPSVTKRWHDAARLLIDNDGRSEDEIRRAIDWCQSHDFWRSNILSMPKLREKYDQMRMQAERAAKPSLRKNDIDWEAATARAVAREAALEPSRKELA